MVFISPFSGSGWSSKYRETKPSSFDKRNRSRSLWNRLEGTHHGYIPSLRCPWIPRCGFSSWWRFFFFRENPKGRNWWKLRFLVCGHGVSLEVVAFCKQVSVFGMCFLLLSFQDGIGLYIVRIYFINNLLRRHHLAKKWSLYWHLGIGWGSTFSREWILPSADDDQQVVSQLFFCYPPWNKHSPTWK